MRKLKQSTAHNVMVLLVSSADHVSPVTGATLNISASKDGAAFASITPVVTERGNGWYSLALTTAHTNTLGDLAMHITATSADPLDMVLLVEGGSVDADVSTRLPTASYSAPPSAASIRSEIDSNSTKLDATVSSRLASGSYTAPDNSGIAAIKAKTDNLPASPAAASDVQTGLTAQGYTAARATKLDNLDAAVSSRSTLDGSGVQTALTSQGYTSARAGYLDVLNGIVQAIWDKATTALTTVGSIGKRIADYLDASVSSRLASASYSAPVSAADVRAEMDANSTKLAHLDADVSTRLATAGYTAPPTVSAIRAEIDANSTKLDAAVSTRLASGSYVAPDNAGVAAIKAKTDNLPADPAGASDIPSPADIDTELSTSHGSGQWDAVSALTAAAVRAEMDANSSKLAQLDASMSSRLAAGSYVAPDNAGIAAIKAKTDNLPAAPVSVTDLQSILDTVIDGGLTLADVHRILLAAAAGKRTGMGTNTERYMAQDGSTPRITFSPSNGLGDGTPVLDGSP